MAAAVGPPAPAAAAGDADACAAWRSPIALRAKQFSPHVAVSQPVRPIPRITCLAVHSGSDTVAVAGYERIALLSVAGSGKESKKPTAVSFSELASAKTPSGRAQSVAFSGPSLLLGCDDSLAHVYRFDPARPFDPTPAASFAHPEHAASHHGAQNFAPSPRVRASALHPTDDARFATSVGPFCFLWSAERSTPLSAFELLPGPVRCIDWSPHSVNQLATGGAGGRLCLLDARLASSDPKKAVVAELPAAHELGVRVLRWSPLVPNWLASAGDGGMVRVWDTRKMSEPAASLDSHLGPATGLSWSRVHCEFIATGGLDGTWRLNSLQLAPTYQLLQHSESFSTSLAAVEFSRCTVSQLVAASTAGELVGISLARRFLAPLTPSGFPPSALEERLAETSLYTRDLAAAYAQALAVVRRHIGKERERVDTAAAAAATGMLALCCPAQYDASAPFERQLRDYAYLLPPNFPWGMAGVLPPDPEVKKELDALRTQVKLVAAAGAPGQDAAAGLSALAREVAGAVEADPAAFDAPALLQVLDGIGRRDGMRALALGARLAEIFAAQGRFEAFAPIARSLLSPSVFEAPEGAPEEARKAARLALSRAVKNPAGVMSQLALMSEVAAAAASGAGASALVEIFASQGLQKDLPPWEIVHAPTVQRLLDALLELKMEGNYLRAAGRLHQARPARPRPAPAAAPPARGAEPRGAAGRGGSALAAALEENVAQRILPRLTQAAAEAAGAACGRPSSRGRPRRGGAARAVLLPLLAAVAFCEGLVPAPPSGSSPASSSAPRRPARPAPLQRSRPDGQGPRRKVAAERLARGVPEGAKYADEVAAALARLAAASGAGA
eukprot:tig00020903_g15124.t1